jgi:hypothetical protein
MKEKGLSPRQVADEPGASETTIVHAGRGNILDGRTIIHQRSEWIGVKPSALLNSLTTTKMRLPDKITILLST